MDSLCDSCKYNAFDEETEEAFCDLQLDEDEFAAFLARQNEGKPCRYFCPEPDEYGIVRKQN